MKRGSQKQFLISGGRSCACDAGDRAAHAKLFLFFFSPPSLFSVPWSLHHKFKLPFLSVVRTHKDDKYFFMMPHVLLDTVMHCPSEHCSSVLPRVIGLNGVTIFSESHKTRWDSAPHSSHFSLLGANGAWVAW